MEYKEEFNNDAYKICKYLDVVDIQLAEFFEVSLTLLYEWCRVYPSFLKSINKGLEEHSQYLKNKEKKKEKRREYRKTESQRKASNIYQINRYKTDIKTHIRTNFASQMRARLKNKTQTGVFRHLGYTVKELKQHLEKQFDDKMSWDNYGSYWHIDHIVPDSWFTYKTELDEQFKQSWALSNLQPLSKTENLKKGNRYSG